MTVRAVAFWAAVLLPFASLVVVFAGPVSRLDFLVLLGLLSANVVALYLGHGYPAERLAEGDGAAADGVVADGADAVSGRTGEGSD
ncbi:hypothetical protein [Halobaculum litoreum]|uniref:Uncharacterized protein n=1 Tax=Halobaculum litoreum TaxID=3031998 RepID=A0ABD5XQ40_9EURY|nr:hypothetical protein [Halobaculum sp. DT92]